MLLAFGFTTPLLLWGLLFAAAPVLIHLLLKRESRRTRWAAMQFLLAATQKQSRWSRLDHWLLLAVRTCIPLLIALALAGPVMQLAQGAAGRQPTHRILVIDSTLSMQTVDASTSRATSVRQDLVELTQKAQPGDTWQILLMDRVPRAVIPEPTFLLDPVREELQNWTPSSTAADPVPSLQMVLQWLQSAERLRSEVHLLTDAQRTTWRSEDAAQRAQQQTLLKDISQRATLQWHDYSSTTVSNAAVTALQVSAPFAVIGERLRIQATIERYGDDVEPRTLTWRIDGRQMATQNVEFTGSQAVCEWKFTPSGASDLRIEAALTPDSLAVDDQRATVVVVREALRVLLVDGRASRVAFENATDCLRLALSPETIPDASSRMEITVIPDGQLLSTPLEAFDVIFLSDVPLISDREAELISRYVTSGGGLVIGMGPSVQVENYHQTLGGETRRLLPARLGELVGDPQLRENSFAFRSDEFQHRILQPFRGNPNTGFELTQTFAYLRAFPEKDAQVAVAFESGDPAIVERSYGHGKVLLVTTALDRSWGTWPVWGHTFVPMMHETVKYLLANQFQSRQVQVGEPLILRLPASKAGDSIQVRRPDDRPSSLPAVAVRTDDAITFEETDRPGFYGMETSGTTGPLAWFAVQTDPRESNLTPLSASDMRDDLFAGTNPDVFSATDNNSGELVPEAASLKAQESLPRWMIGLALILLIGEPFLAWNRPTGWAVIASLGLTVWGGFTGGTLGALAMATVAGIFLLIIILRYQNHSLSVE